jgi:mannosyltransferase OCH1-like enzyme
VLHRIWVGPPIPDRLASIGVAWKVMLPGWEHRLWSDDDLGWLQNRDLYDAAEQLVPADAVGQFRADIARYEILARFGGVYVDCDLEPLRDITPLHVWGAWAGWEVQDRFVGNTILGGQPGNRFWQAAVDRLPASVKANRGKRPNRMSGPHYTTRLLNDIGGLHVYPQTFFYPYAHNELDRHDEDPGEAYTRHLWWHQRTLRGKPVA